jgi:phosphoribosyl 1,2-cyclic phosphate phosphodiesterase
MKWTILGSGGCMVIPKPLCQCRICREARVKGIPYSRTGPSSFLHDINLLIDTPSEIISQLNRCDINRIDYLIYTHLDPDHIEGSRVIEQSTLDFRTWKAYPNKRINLLITEKLIPYLRKINTVYGSVFEFYEKSKFINIIAFHDKVKIKNIEIIAIPVDRGGQPSFIYVFQKANRKVVYAACDIKPFPEANSILQKPDLLIIQPGMFETHLKHRFKYQPEHISRTTLYTFKQTVALAKRIQAKRTVFIHLEEYWNRNYDDYLSLEAAFNNIKFAYDGLQLSV